MFLAVIKPRNASSKSSNVIGSKWGNYQSVGGMSLLAFLKNSLSKRTTFLWLSSKKVLCGLSAQLNKR